MGMQGCRALFIRGYIQSGLSVRDLHCGQGNKRSCRRFVGGFSIIRRIGSPLVWRCQVESSPRRRSVSDKLTTGMEPSWNIKKSNYKSLVKTGISAEDAVEWIEADDFELLNSIAFIIAKRRYEHFRNLRDLKSYRLTPAVNQSYNSWCWARLSMNLW